MTIGREAESKLLASILRLTSSGSPLDREQVAEESGVTLEVADELIRRTLPDVYSHRQLDGAHRVRVMVRLAELDYDVERVARFLSWRELENYVSSIASTLGFRVFRNVRFKAEGRRFEVDVVAASSRGLLLLDCKRWKTRLSGNTAQQVSGKHLRRAHAFASLIQDRLRGTLAVAVCPALVTILEPETRLVSACNVVPIHTLPSFLNEFDTLFPTSSAVWLRLDWLENIGSLLSDDHLLD